MKECNRNLRNRMIKGQLKQAFRAFKEKKISLPELQSKIDKTAQKGVIHVNKASRLFSRASLLCSRINQGRIK